MVDRISAADPGNNPKVMSPKPLWLPVFIFFGR